jgi:hypothetical protein
VNNLTSSLRSCLKQFKSKTRSRCSHSSRASRMMKLRENRAKDDLRARSMCSIFGSVPRAREVSWSAYNSGIISSARNASCFKSEARTLNVECCA